MSIQVKGGDGTGIEGWDPEGKTVEIPIPVITDLGAVLIEDEGGDQDDPTVTDGEKV
ncbi:MAG TPA: hypothetical protein VJB99_03565 [Patescibacteria group bacterium]|nr:hypothetical protein [Patescibacteria group bacterium]